MVIRPQIAIRVVAARCTAAHRQNARCDAQDDLVKRLQLLVLGRRERAVSRDAHGDDSACAANQRDCMSPGRNHRPGRPSISRYSPQHRSCESFRQLGGLAEPRSRSVG
eukprot:CAMPEP_0113259152 /NCGR_PEP_ID=MMETSP0008_2-20120614/16206_1 /TAXON_ID=97485 /ORGANISM="Prymnesium parvum" /LENGTH=108 /DNA_ID=CAMNT_0000107665 /DNA_START=649 /DNA_END=972 /DNA_ORIENTATION=+ /assembly_acc=CAM_ASM_000153